MKLIEMYLSQFVPLQVVQPPLTFYSTSCWFALQIAMLHLKKVESEKEKGEVEEMIETIKEIIRCTHEELNVSIYAVEATVTMTPLNSWGDVPDLMDNDGNPLLEKSVFLLFTYLRKSFEKVVKIVTDIGFNYSVEIPSSGFLTPSTGGYRPKIGD